MKLIQGALGQEWDLVAEACPAQVTELAAAYALSIRDGHRHASVTVVLRWQHKPQDWMTFPIELSAVARETFIPVVLLQAYTYGMTTHIFLMPQAIPELPYVPPDFVAATCFETVAAHVPFWWLATSYQNAEGIRREGINAIDALGIAVAVGTMSRRQRSVLREWALKGGDRRTPLPAAYAHAIAEDRRAAQRQALTAMLHGVDAMIAASKDMQAQAKYAANWVIAAQEVATAEHDEIQILCTEAAGFQDRTQEIRRRLIDLRDGLPKHKRKADQAVSEDSDEIQSDPATDEDEDLV